MNGDASPITLNEYVYCRNSALNYLDCLGTTEVVSNDSWWEIMRRSVDADITLKNELKTRYPDVKDPKYTGQIALTNVYIPAKLDSAEKQLKGYIWAIDQTKSLYIWKNDAAT